MKETNNTAYKSIIPFIGLLIIAFLLTECKSSKKVTESQTTETVTKEEPKNTQQEEKVIADGKRNKAIGDIKSNSQELEIQLTKISDAFKKDDFVDISSHSGKIQVICDDIARLSADLAPNEKATISESVIAVKVKAHELEDLAKQGHSKHDAVHHENDNLKKEFENLKTLINGLN